MTSRRILFGATAVVSGVFSAVVATAAWLVTTSPDGTHAGMTLRDVAVVGGIPLVLLALAAAALCLRPGATGETEAIRLRTER